MWQWRGLHGNLSPTCRHSRGSSKLWQSSERPRPWLISGKENIAYAHTKRELVMMCKGNHLRQCESLTFLRNTVAPCLSSVQSAILGQDWLIPCVILNSFTVLKLDWLLSYSKYFYRVLFLFHLTFYRSSHNISAAEGMDSYQPVFLILLHECIALPRGEGREGAKKKKRRCEDDRSLCTGFMARGWAHC